MFASDKLSLTMFTLRPYVLTVMAGCGEESVSLTRWRVAKPGTTVQDSVPTFVGMKPLNVFKATLCSNQYFVRSLM